MNVRFVKKVMKDVVKLAVTFHFPKSLESFGDILETENDYTQDAVFHKSRSFPGWLVVHQHDVLGEGAEKVAFSGKVIRSGTEDDGFWFPAATRTIVAVKYLHHGQTVHNFAESGSVPSEMVNELSVAMMAKALQGQTDVWIKSLQEKIPQSRKLELPPVPRIVNSCIAKTKAGNAFLIEEIIPDLFVKFVNNKTPEPTVMAQTTVALKNLADFLCFCQHIQFIFTSGMVIISDYQGL